MKKGFTLLELFIIVSVVCILILMAIPKLSDVKESRMASEMQNNLVDMRIALEEYYIKTGEYPDLVGAQDDLRDVVSSDGSVSFGEILGRRTLVKTPKVEEIEATNKIYDVSDFEKATESGGWNYNQSRNTGEIHVNLPANIFGQEIDWSVQ